MPVKTDISAPPSPSLVAPDAKGAPVTEPYIHSGTGSDDFLDIFDMTGNFGSPSPYIKDEPEDRLFGSPHPSRLSAHAHSAFALAEQSSSLGAFGHSHGSDGSVDPADLTMHGDSLSTQNGIFTPTYPSFGAPQNVPFNMANSGLADDELLSLGNLDELSHRDDFFGSPDLHARGAVVQPGHHSLQQHLHQQHEHPARQHSQHQPHGHGPYHTAAAAAAAAAAAVASSPLDHTHSAIGMSQIYSPHPDGSAVSSPFASALSYEHFSPPSGSAHTSLAGPYAQSLKAASPYDASSGQHVGSQTGSFDRRQLHHAAAARAVRSPHSGEGANPSHMRSALAPRTSALSAAAGLTLATPESGSFPQPIHAARLAQARHQRTLSSSQWDGPGGSVQSYVDSPLSSPGGHTSHHVQISSVLKSGKPSSLPAKVEGATGVSSGPAFQTQEAKRRRRRESHNLVERRRRDNINERIQELSHLVPQHRLEDERVRKHLLNNSPLSPGLGALGASPPPATSLLAGGVGRRAAAAMATGIPAEEKDKGPNKGDILNGSVSWMRDLMWALHAKYQQESELADYIASLGGVFPFELTEEDRRMRTELLDAMDKNDASSFSYSRAPGSGLRVPKHTNLAGESINQQQQHHHHGNTMSGAGVAAGAGAGVGVGAGLSPRSMSPANLSGESRHTSVGHSSGALGLSGQSGHSSGGSGQNSVNFKEEDEYAMDMT